MLMIRLIFVLLVITAMVFLGLYLLQNDQKYLKYFKKTVQYLIYLLLLVAVLFVVRRTL